MAARVRMPGTFLEGNALDLRDYLAQGLTKISQDPKDADAYLTLRAKAVSEATEQRFAEHAPQDIFTLSLQTGQSKVILKGTDWLRPPFATLQMWAACTSE
jgi:hypothetical protein